MNSTVARKSVEESELFSEAESLSLNDRCDANESGAEQAFVRFRSGSKVVDLCMHHANLYEPGLIANGWIAVVDNRETINVKPSPSASIESGM